MDKPTKPTDLIPRSFGGVKNNFSSSLQSSGYEDGVPAIYGGDNLNYQLDATGKELDYCEKICDYINAIPINKTPIVDANNKLTYTQYDIKVYNSTDTYGENELVTGIVNGVKDIYRSLQDNNMGHALNDTTWWIKTSIIGNGGNRNIGEIVTSTMPLDDAGLHLLDGSLISGSGSYAAFVSYMADLYDSGDYTDIFDTEANWQSAVTTYGVCGKFVYDDVNDTVRLPKYGNQIFTKPDIATASTVPVKGNGKALGVTNGTTNGGMIGASTNSLGFYGYSNAYDANVSTTPLNTGTAIQGTVGVTTDGTKSGLVADISSFTNQYGLDCYWYIVIATTAKTDIQVDIDEIATDLNGKADVDLTNLNNAGSIVGAGLAMPSNTYDTLTIGASGTTYTAPANGYFAINGLVTTSGNASFSLSNDTNGIASLPFAWYGATGGTYVRGFVPVKKGDIVTIYYPGAVTSFNVTFRFIYAQGSESEHTP